MDNKIKIIEKILFIILVVLSSACMWKIGRAEMTIQLAQFIVLVAIFLRMK